MKKVKQLARRTSAILAGAAAPLGVGVGNAYGAAGVNITSNTNGLPGLSQMEKIVGALITLAVIAAVAGLVISAIIWAVGNHSANPQISGRGKAGVLVAGAAAILAGGAMAIINFFFNIGAQI